jgi:hypothetical protein
MVPFEKMSNVDLDRRKCGLTNPMVYSMVIVRFGN